MAHAALPPPLVAFVVGATGTGKTAVAVEMAQALKHEHGYHTVCVVNCDVLQFYGGLPVATNKATPDELVFRDGTPIPHYFMSFLSMDGTVLLCHPTTPYHEIVASQHDANDGAAASVSTSALAAPHHAPVALSEPYHVHHYVRDVEAFLWGTLFPAAQKEGTSCAVIVCGGSNYYSQALLFANTLVDDVCEGGDASMRANINDSNVATTNGCVADAADIDRGDGGWAALNAVDPLAASQVHPQNTRRIARLLQIAQQGRKPSDVFGGQRIGRSTESGDDLTGGDRGPRQVNGPLKLWGPVPLRIADVPVQQHRPLVHPRLALIWVDGERDWLMQRLDGRVDDMLRRGLLDEVRAFARAVQQAAPPGDNGDLTGSSKRPRTSDGSSALTSVAAPLLCSGTLATAIGFKEWQPLLAYWTERHRSSVQDGGPAMEDPTFRRLLAECTQAVQRATRRYAKQQVQWIRNRFLGVYKHSWWQQRTTGDDTAGAVAVPVPVLRFRMDVCLMRSNQKAAELQSSNSNVLASTVGGVVRQLVAAPTTTGGSHVPLRYGGDCGDSGDGGDCCCVEQVFPPRGARQAEERAKTAAVVDGVESSCESAGGGVADTKTLHRCATCGIVASGDAQWQAHVASKRHRGALRHAALVVQQRALGREIPPRAGRK